MEAGRLPAAAAWLTLLLRSPAETAAVAHSQASGAVAMAVDGAGAMLQLGGRSLAASRGPVRSQMMRRQAELFVSPDSPCPNDKHLAGYRFSHAGYWDNYTLAGSLDVSGCKAACDAARSPPCLGFSVTGAGSLCYTYQELKNERPSNNPLTDFAMVKCDEHLPFDCTAGFDMWQQGWSMDKKRWCCTFKSRGCETRERSTCVQPIMHEAVVRAQEYMDCLGQKCEDAEGEFLQTILNRSFANCDRLMSRLSNDCDADLSLMCDGDCAQKNVPMFKLPQGTMLSHLCNKKCPKLCHKERWELLRLQHDP